MAYLNTSANQPWSLNVDRAGTMDLSTAGKFLDRDIKVTVPAGSVVVNIPTQTGENNGTATVTNPKVTPKLTGGIIGITSDTAPSGTEGADYIVVGSDATKDSNGSVTFSNIAAKATVTAGYVDAGTIPADIQGSFTDSSIQATVATGQTRYLPIKRSLAEENISKVNYIQAEVGQTGTFNDKLEITVNVPEGYYKLDEPLKVTYENILPSADANATANYILTGQKAYDTNGNILVGTMANVRIPGQADFVSTAGNGSVSGSNVTLGTTDNSGISVSGKGSVTQKISLSEGYYITAQTEGPAVESNTQTKYIDQIALGTDKTLAKITNNGTITEVDGTGVISTLSGTQTISNLTGALTVTAAQDANSASEHSNAKLIFGSQTLVEDGELITGSIRVNETTGKVEATHGWVDSDKTLDIKKGETSVALTTKTQPSVAISTTQNGVTISQENTGFAITVVATPTNGTYTATASTTEGYQNANDVTPADKEIAPTVTGAGAVYLKASNNGTYSYSTAYHTHTGLASGIVPQKYVLSITEGYTAGVTKDIADVYDGTYSWS